MSRIGILLATAFVDMVGFAMVFPLLPFYALRLGARPWMIGAMIAAFSVAQLASAPLWGRVSDRYGRRPALVVALAASAAGFLVFAFAEHVLLLFVSRLVQGAGGGTTGVAQAYVGDTVPAEDRARALGWLSAATSAGVMIGPALGSSATLLGPPAPGLIAALLCLLNAAAAWRWLPESHPRSARGEAPGGRSAGARRPIRAALLEVLRAPRAPVPALIWVYAVGMLGFMSMTAVLALYLRGRFGVSERTIGLFFLLTGSLSLVLRGLLLGALVDRLGELRVARLGATLLAAGLVAMPLQPSLPLFLAALALVPLGTGCLFPSTSALVSRRAPPAELGQTLGVQQAFGGAARVLAPLWSTAAFEGLGPRVPFLVAAAVVAAGGLLTRGVGGAGEPARRVRPEGDDPPPL